MAHKRAVSATLTTLLKGIYRLLLSDEHEPVNIGNPVETTILEFASAINRLTENPAGVTFRPSARSQSDPQRRRPDISRARQALGWEPKVSLEEGLKRTIPYFMEELGKL